MKLRRISITHGRHPSPVSQSSCSTQRPIVSVSFRVSLISNKGLENSLSFFSVIIFPWLKPEALHEGCPTAIGFYNRPLGGGERGLYRKGVSHGFHVGLDVKREGGSTKCISHWHFGGRWVLTLLLSLRQGSLVHVPMLATGKQSFSRYIDKTHGKTGWRVVVCWMAKCSSEKAKIWKCPAFLPAIAHMWLGPS